MILGIDLGTTNSLIGYKEEYLSDLIPSIVDLPTKRAGEELRYNYKTTRSFKPNISLGVEGIKSVHASACVLHELITIAKKAGYDSKEVVITVPADFNDNQRNATKKAAEQAGLDVKGLLNEPTAAALKIAKGIKALLLVFDLGGGTFDISVVDSRFGAYDVQDTDGLILGGDNFDAALRDFFAKKASIRMHALGTEKLNALKDKCKDYKIQMQKERKEFTCDFSDFAGGKVTFTPDEYITVMKMVFLSAVTKTKNIMERSIDSDDTVQLLFVGGSTRCPFLREWVTSELGIKESDMDYDPDRVVAQGAAIYADMLEHGTVDEQVMDVTKRLAIRLFDGTTETIIDKNSKIPVSEERMFYNHDTSASLTLELFQGDALLAESNEYLGALVYQYEEAKKAFEGEVYVTVTVNRDGTIDFECREILKDPVKVKLRRGGQES